MRSKATEQAWLGWRSLALGVPIAVALSILGGTILFGSQYLRHRSREQITGQHAQILYALWLSQKLNEEFESGLNLGENPADLLPAVLETARLRQLVELLGTRVFDADGNFVFADAHVTEGTLDPDDLDRLRELKPVAHLRENADLSEVSLALSTNAVARGPLLEVCIPLHAPSQQRLAGVAEFILDGSNVAAEFRQLDRHLLVQGLLTFAVGGGLLVLVLWASFHQWQRMNQLLAERTQRLLQANQELALSAKTSAVGAVTAHLIHGLRNPLSGLQNFVASRAGAEDYTEAEWQLAVSSTKRMQTMIGEIVRVLRDEEGASQYELSLEEFAQILEAKVRPLAREAGVEFSSGTNGNAVLRNREANLLSLVLFNLAQNAIQATPKGKHVSVGARVQDGKITWEVRDEGPGIGEAQRAELFKPTRSAKEGGSGIGLAISKQLANSIGAELELIETSSEGSMFVLTYGFDRQV